VKSDFTGLVGFNALVALLFAILWRPFVMKEI
jgi:hypothetical protein